MKVTHRQIKHPFCPSQEFPLHVSEAPEAFLEFCQGCWQSCTGIFDSDSDRSHPVHERGCRLHCTPSLRPESGKMKDVGYIKPGAYVYAPCCCQRPRWYPWLVLPSRTMVVVMVHAKAKDHFDIPHLCYHQRPCGCLWSLLPSESESECWCPRALLLSEAILMPMACAAIECTCHSMYLQSMLQLRVVLMSMVYTPTADHVEVHGPCCHQRPCGRSYCCWLQREWSFFCSGIFITADPQLRRRDMKVFCDNLPPLLQKKETV